MDSKQLADRLRAAVLRRDDSAEQLLRTAASHCDVHLIALTQWCALLDDRMRLVAWRSLQRQLSLLRANDVAALEARMRDPVPYVGRTQWDDLRAEDCRQFRREADAWPMLALATLHRSGFVREAALREVASAPRGEYVPFIVSRANDWVPRVRDVARFLARQYLTAEYADRWIDALGLVEALGHARRADHDSLVSAVHALLRSPGVEPLLLNALRSPDSSVRRRAARVFVQHPTADALRPLSGSRDPALRLMALRAAISGQLGDDVVERALLDKALPVRRRAFVEALRRNLIDTARMIDAFMLDRSRSIRELAREWIRKHRPELDLAGAYRRAIVDGSGKVKCIALLGLGETGGTADIDVIAPYLEHALPAVRRFSVMALDGLGTRVPGGVFAAKLLDPAAPVVRAAADALAERMEPSLVAHVWRAVESGMSFVPLHAARCFARLDTWSALAELCDLIPRAPETCARHLESWLRRHISGFRQRPDAATIARVTSALRSSRPALPARLAGELEFVLRTTT